MAAVKAVLIVDDNTVLIDRVEDPLRWAKRVRPELKWFDSFPAECWDGKKPDVGFIVWVDDMGLFQGFPKNNLANAMITPLNPLVGPVLLTGLADEAGNLTDVPDFVLSSLNKAV